MNSCLKCGAAAKIQCQQCKRAYYCSADCKSTDWKLTHEYECEAGENVDASVENRWTGLFKAHTEAYIAWTCAVEETCDPMNEEAVELRNTLDTKLEQLKNQADRRFSEEAVARFSDNLKQYATASLLHDAEADNFKRQLLGGSVNELSRVFGIGQRRGSTSLTKQDYESALTAHINSLVAFTEALKDSSASQEQINKQASSAAHTAIRTGQVFWGRSWRQDLN